MESINEIELRNLLQRGLSPKDLANKILKRISGQSLTWDEERPLWHFLYNTGQLLTIVEMLQLHLVKKRRIPFDLLIEISAKAKVQPSASVIESLLKGLKKQRAFDEIIVAKGFDRWEPRLNETRTELIERKVTEQKRLKENMREKFEFLQNQRMTEQAGRVLGRLRELYPEDEDLTVLQHNFDEQFAREVLANHVAAASSKSLANVRITPSPVDQEMLKMFLLEGETLALEHREFALDLTVAFWFVEDYQRALSILPWALPGPGTDWMHAELLFGSGRYVEALELLNQLEIKYVESPETTFAVSYLRAQCLHALGQGGVALEVMRSIVRVRAHYRSAHALILEWTEGARWE